MKYYAAYIVNILLIYLLALLVFRGVIKRKILSELTLAVLVNAALTALDYHFDMRYFLLHLTYRLFDFDLFELKGWTYGIVAAWLFIINDIVLAVSSILLLIDFVKMRIGPK